MGRAERTEKSLETGFHQYLKEKGHIGLVPTVIEENGPTDLTEVANHFYLDASGTSSGPSLKIYGADYVAGQFGGWEPISAEQTASGYQVALKLAGADQYSVWTTDSNGHYITNLALVNG